MIRRRVAVAARQRSRPILTEPPLAAIAREVSDD